MLRIKNSIIVRASGRVKIEYFDNKLFEKRVLEQFVRFIKLFIYPKRNAFSSYELSAHKLVRMHIRIESMGKASLRCELTCVASNLVHV